MKRFLLVCAVLFGGGALLAQPAGPDYAALAVDCIKGLEALDPAYAKKCGGDAAFLKFVRGRKPNMEAWLVTRSRAIADMETLAGAYSLKISTPALSEALAARIMVRPYADMGAPGHEGIGFGPVPEKTFDWLRRYCPDMPAAQLEKFAVALRGYEALSRIKTGEFSPADMTEVTVSFYIDSYAKKALNKTPGYTVEPRQWWDSLDLRARSSLLAGLAREQMEKVARYGSPYAYEQFRAHWGWAFLRREDLPRMEEYLRNFKRMAALRDKINMTYEESDVKALLDKIAAMPSADREAFLDKMFDGGSGNDAAFDDFVKAVESKSRGRGARRGSNAAYRGISQSDVANAARANAVVSNNLERSVSPEQNDALVAGLNARLASALGGTAAGESALAFYKTNPLTLSMAHGGGFYGKYEPASEKSSGGEIVLNTALVQQYMDMRGITTSQLLSDPAQLTGLSNYVAPLLVHEAAHQMQHSVSAGKMADPYTQSDEAESASAEALFTLEKMKKDTEFAALMNRAQDSSPYAKQLLARADQLSKNPLAFRRQIARQDYPNLPDLETASAQILAIADDELNRRDALCCDELADLERDGFDMDVVSRISVQEMAEIAGSVKTAVLEQVRAEFIKQTNMYETAARAAAKQQVQAAKQLGPL